ncbi:MAG: DUF819 family protein [Alistipes sp.]|jgi:uncharacterized membrane protein|nr:DUF819 family protein [Alistipes sp.]
MAENILLVIFYLVAPAGVLWLCRRVPLLGKIGPILLLYAVGLIVGNLPVMPANAAGVQEVVTNAMIPLAIPMLLFCCTFKRGQTRVQVKALVSGLIAVVVAVVAGYLIFKNNLGPEGAKIGGMITGVYTGGTPNLAALQMMLGVRHETYILMNSYDLVVSAVYLAFLLGIGIRLFRRFLPVEAGRLSSEAGRQIAEEHRRVQAENPYAGFWRRATLSQVGRAAALTLAIVAVSGGVAMGVNAVAGSDKYFMLTLILSLTTLGIAASFWRPVRQLEKSYDAGMYLIYIFSVAVASMADFSRLNLSEGLYLAVYLLFVVFVSLVLQSLLARVMRVDGDSMVVSSVALINSPPFVPMIAAAMGNRDAMVTGLTIGLVGYAVGNYLGVLLAQFLAIL